MNNRAIPVLAGLGVGAVALLAATAALNWTAFLQFGILCLTLLEMDLIMRDSAAMRRAAVLPALAAIALAAFWLRDSMVWLLPVVLLAAVRALERRKSSPRRFLLLALAIPGAAALVVFFYPAPRDLTAFIMAAHVALAAGAFVLAPEKEVPGSAKKTFRLPLCSMFWLGFHLLGIAMTVMKCYPVPVFLPFIIGIGAAVYAILTQSESMTVRMQTVLFALFGVILLGDRIMQLSS